MAGYERKGQRVSSYWQCRDLKKWGDYTGSHDLRESCHGVGTWMSEGSKQSYSLSLRQGWVLRSLKIFTGLLWRGYFHLVDNCAGSDS